MPHFDDDTSFITVIRFGCTMRLPKLPGYELVDRLGGGPFTHVYAGIHQASERRVAIKVPRHIEFGRLLLHREAAAGLNTRHPHLVRVRRAFLESTPSFLVLDWIDGEALRDRLHERMRFDLRSALWITRQTAEALAALHRVGFVHGDVKPENVLLTPDAGIVLIDLGFAHRPGDNAVFQRNGVVLGTANYLAPEICKLDGVGGLATDIFSLGVMLFELLTGHLPYPPGDVSATLLAHRKQAAADLGPGSGDWPVPLQLLVRRMLSRQPGNRPSASHLVRELVALEVHALGCTA